MWSQDRVQWILFRVSGGIMGWTNVHTWLRSGEILPEDRASAPAGPFQCSPIALPTGFSLFVSASYLYWSPQCQTHSPCQPWSCTRAHSRLYSLSSLNPLGPSQLKVSSCLCLSPLPLHSAVSPRAPARLSSELSGLCCMQTGFPVNFAYPPVFGFLRLRSVAKLCPILCDPMDCSTPDSCPPLSPRACSNSCPLSQWCHPTILSSVIPFSSCLQSFPASGSFPTSRLFASGGLGLDFPFSGVIHLGSRPLVTIKNWWPGDWWHFSFPPDTSSFISESPLSFRNDRTKLLLNKVNKMNKPIANSCLPNLDCQPPTAAMAGPEVDGRDWVTSFINSES